MVKHNERSDQ